MDMSLPSCRRVLVSLRDGEVLAPLQVYSGSAAI